MYHIISFVDIEEVEVVPAIWVKNGVCLWPLYKGEGTLRAIKCLEQPQESWSAYTVRIMYTGNNYSEACQKLLLVEAGEISVRWCHLQSEAEPDTLRPPKCKIKRNRCLLDDYDTDDETTKPLSKRICSGSNNLQPSNLRERQKPPPCLHQKSTFVAQIAETSRPSLLEIGPAAEWHKKTPGSSLTCLKQLCHVTRCPSRRGKQEGLPEHHMTSQITTLNSHGNRTQLYRLLSRQHMAPWHYETRKGLSSYYPFITSLLHDIITKQENLMKQQRYIRMVQDLKGRFVHHASRSLHSTLCGSRRAWEQA